jgi:hypothetical protein
VRAERAARTHAAAPAKRCSAARMPVLSRLRGVRGRGREREREGEIEGGREREGGRDSQREREGERERGDGPSFLKVRDLRLLIIRREA